MGLAGKIALCDPEDIASGADLRRIKETGEILDRTDGPVSVRLCTVMHGNDDPGIQLLRHVSGGPGVDGIKTSNGKQKDIDASKKLVKHLGIEHTIINIRGAFDSILDEMKEAQVEPSQQTITNLPARLRMAVTYAVSQSKNGQ